MQCACVIPVISIVRQQPSVCAMEFSVCSHVKADFQITNCKTQIFSQLHEGYRDEDQNILLTMLLGYTTWLLERHGCSGH